jgi:hypothetical protein
MLEGLAFAIPSALVVELDGRRLGLRGRRWGWGWRLSRWLRYHGLGLDRFLGGGLHRLRLRLGRGLWPGRRLGLAGHGRQGDGFAQACPLTARGGYVERSGGRTDALHGFLVVSGGARGVRPTEPEREQDRQKRRKNRFTN